MLGPKYNFEFTDIDKLQEIVTEKHKKYNYLSIFSIILLVLTLVLSIIFGIFNHHFLCLMFFFFFTTSFIPIHICCNVEEIYKQNKNILDMYNKITELKAPGKVSDIRLCYQYGHLEISYFDENDILRKDSYRLNIDKNQLYYYKKQNYLIRDQL